LIQKCRRPKGHRRSRRRWCWRDRRRGCLTAGWLLGSLTAAVLVLNGCCAICVDVTVGGVVPAPRPLAQQYTYRQQQTKLFLPHSSSLLLSFIRQGRNAG